MGRRATEGTDVRALVKLALPVFKQAERQCPRTGPGAKPKYVDRIIAALIMIAVLKKKKSKSAQYRYVCRQRRSIVAWLGLASFPSRATYFRRYRRAHRLYKTAIYLQGQRALAEGVTDAQDVAVDKSLMTAQGPPWHQRQRRAGKTPPGVDREASWGYSEHTGWVYGFSYEVVVAATADATVLPLLASADTASISETRTFAPKIEQLPAQTQNVSADSAFDTNDYGERVEFDEQGRRTGRHFLCPENPRNTKGRKLKPAADARQAQRRARRQQRQRFLRSRRGQRRYAQRSKTVEPFNQWFKSLFELDQRVWHRGLDNNRTQILAAIFLYQLLTRYNHRLGNKNGRLRWILDGL
jgi:Transposase DDE domain